MKNILIGGSEICGWIHSYAIGFKKLGYQVTTVVKSKDVQRDHLKYDINLENAIPKSKFELFKRVHYRQRIKQLINMGYNYNITDSDGDNALHRAAAGAHIQIAAELLLNTQIDINAQNVNIRNLRNSIIISSIDEY